MRNLLDTNIFSYYLKDVAGVRERVAAEIKAEGTLYLSAAVEYEVLRGLLHKDARGQLRSFLALQSDSTILPLDAEVMKRATTVWARLATIGKKTGELDILIASTALVHDMRVVTNNVADFEHIEGLVIDNWVLQ